VTLASLAVVDLDLELPYDCKPIDQLRFATPKRLTGGLLEEEVVDQVACLRPLDCLEEGLQVGLALEAPRHLVDELSVLALAESFDDVTDLLDFFVRDAAVGNDRDLQKGDQREPLVLAKIRKLHGALIPARWRTSKRACDTLFALYPEVDQNRIGTLGFSEGAVVSLLMAGHDPDRIKAVVAYYPITDFPYWYSGERSGVFARALFALARWQLRVESRDRFVTRLELKRRASPVIVSMP
jgi:Prolyl oligopeptidase family